MLKSSYTNGLRGMKRLKCYPRSGSGAATFLWNNKKSVMINIILFFVTYKSAEVFIKDYSIYSAESVIKNSIEYGCWKA